MLRELLLNICVRLIYPTLVKVLLWGCSLLVENMVAKYQSYACNTGDAVLKDRYEQIAKRHQRHYDELYANLK